MASNTFEMVNSNTIWHGVRLDCIHKHLYNLYFWKTSLISQRQAYCTVFIFLLFAPAFIPVPSNPTDCNIILSCFKKGIQKHRASWITTWSQSRSKLISETKWINFCWFLFWKRLTFQAAYSQSTQTLKIHQIFSTM